MPETPETAKELLKIKQDIIEIRQSQEVSQHINRDKYEKLVSDTLTGNSMRVRVFLEVDGIKSRKEIQEKVNGTQPTVWRTIEHLNSHGLIYDTERTKGGSPIYAKPQWAKTLRMDDYVRLNFPITQTKAVENGSQSGNSDNKQSA